MAIQIIGYGGVIADVDGTTYRALKVTQRPAEYGLLGQYRLAASTGTVTGSTLAGLFQFYWSSSLAIALVWGFTMDYSGSSTVGGINNVKLIVERSVTAYGSGGTTISVPGTSGQNQQLRTSMRPSLVPLVLVATTAGLNNGTWIPDTNGIGSMTFAVDTLNVNKNILTQCELLGDLERRTSSPLVLSQNEALSLLLATPSSPTYVVGVNIAWSEVGYY
jgi:hypothetical protein